MDLNKHHGTNRCGCVYTNTRTQRYTHERRAPYGCGVHHHVHYAIVRVEGEGKMAMGGGMFIVQRLYVEAVWVRMGTPLLTFWDSFFSRTPPPPPPPPHGRSHRRARDLSATCGDRAYLWDSNPCRS